MQGGLITTLGLAAALAVGGLIGAAPAATGNGQAGACQSPSTSSTGATSSTASSTTTPTTPDFTPPQPEGSPVNNNTVENCQDGTKEIRSKLQVGVAGAKVANPANYAVAYAHDCNTGCQAIAAAFQVALVPRGAQQQTPQNVALAVNLRCQHCAAFAFAYQYAVEVPKGTRLSRQIRGQIAAIAREADTDVKAGLSFPTLDARLHTLAGELRAAVDAGLQKQHVPETRKHASQRVRENDQR